MAVGAATDADGAVARARPRRWLEPVLLLAPVVLLVGMGWARRWVYEDAFLNFRVVDQIRAGNGPVFNIGERVEVATSSAWLALLVVMRTVVPFVRIEWSSIVVGLACTAGGLWLAERAARRLWTRAEPDPAPTFVPFGALVYVALLPAWDWSTSGLENGLSILWIGGVATVLSGYGAGRDPVSARRVVASGIVLGLGPLVRPDLVVVSAVAILAVLWVRRPRLAEASRFLLGAAAIPVTAEVLRAGYYGVLVPNTVLAKDGFGVYWAAGWKYLLDFVEPYRLVVPLVLVGVALVGLLLRGRGRPGPAVVGVLALPLAGALYTTSITRAGGDYLHGRLLLVALFALLAPVMAVPWRRWLLVPGVLLVVWAGLALTTFRPEHGHGGLYALVTDRGILDGRVAMLDVTRPGRDPVFAEDVATDDAAIAKRLQAHGARALVTVSADGRAPLLHVTPDRTTLISVASGRAGYQAGIDVDLHEGQALGDAVGSHMPAIRPSYPGHRKRESWPWMLAMTTRSDAPTWLDGTPAHRQLVDARRALRCGAAAELGAATRAPLTPGRFWSNLTGAWGRTFVEIPRDPEVAARRLCR